MWRKGGRFLVGSFAVVSLTFLGIAVMAIPSTPEGACLNKYGRDPQAVCPTYSGQQCWCDTNAKSRPGYCCGTVTVHGEKLCCIYLSAREVYPCKLPNGSGCGYAGCTDPNGPGCGQLSDTAFGECVTDPSLPSYASCREGALVF